MLDGSSKYLLVDFMNMAFRAYYAYSAQMSFTDDEGTPTGMTYGLLSMTLSLIRDTGATHVAFANESRVRTFNAELVQIESLKDSTLQAAFPAGYKGSRKEMEPTLRAQLDMAERACIEMGWPVYRSEGYEADDTLASLAALANALGHKAVIVTGDQDLWQCVSEGTTVYAPKPRGVYLEITPKTFGEFMEGLTPKQIVEYKAIVGDASDGYPGCPGIGPKGAHALLQEYGTVESVYEHIDSIKGAAQTKLIANKPLVMISRELARLNPQAPVDFDPSAGKVTMPYPESAATFIRKHGMASLEKRIGRESFPEETHDAFPL